METAIKTIELKYLTTYLPYDTDARDKSNKIYVPSLRIDNIQKFLSGDHLLVLRPLSDLTKEISINGKKFIPFEKLKEDYVTNLILGNNTIYLDQKFDAQLNVLSISDIRDKLIEWNFDVFRLIEKGIVVDINTIK